MARHCDPIREKCSLILGRYSDQNDIPSFFPAFFVLFAKTKDELFIFQTVGRGDSGNAEYENKCNQDGIDGLGCGTLLFGVRINLCGYCFPD